MEFFERAHVVKKSSKTKQVKKNQLRQMLSGYKQNNNELIKHSDEIDDASSSVSGFSDLNLTGSPDTTKAESIEHHDDEDCHKDETQSSYSDVDSVASINGSSGSKSTIDSESDGELDNSMDSSVVKEKINELFNVIESPRQVFVAETKKKKRRINDNLGSESPPYVSVVAKDMLDESFQNVVGDYKYSTVKNLPWDCQNVDAQFYCDPDTVEDVECCVNSGSDCGKIEGNSVEYEMDEVSKLDQVEEDTINVDDTNNSIERELSIESVDTTLVNPVKVFYGQNNVILVLKHPINIYIHGKVEATKLGGCMEILGYKLQDKPCEVYAPNYNCAQCLKTVENQNEYYGLFGKLTASGLTVADAEEIVTTIGENDGVILLKPLKNSKVNFMQDNFTIADLFSKSSKHIDNILRNASDMLGCSLSLTRPWRCYVEDPKWIDVVKYGKNVRSRGIICGGKGLGKSNFLRYYINSLLSNGPVLVIDLDPGQAEFTVAGNMSATVVTEPLLGPAFTHLKRPELMLNVGMINTMDNPKRYISAIDTLITHCSNNEHLRNMPWIVNTMGMVNALGLKFITYTILRLSPTFLFQIDSNNTKKRFEHNLTSEEICRVYYEKCQTDRMFTNLICPRGFNYKYLRSEFADDSFKNNSLAPKDERYLNFLSYFAQSVTASNKAGLLGITPYKISLNAINVVLNVKLEADVLNILNGKVVALCEEKHCNTGKLFTLRDKPIPCHGHGLIRGVDREKWELYIVTAIPGDFLVKVNTIVYADWVPEIRGQEQYLPEGVTVPYRTCTEYQQRQLMFSPRRRFNPIQLLKMSRSS